MTAKINDPGKRSTFRDSVQTLLEADKPSTAKVFDQETGLEHSFTLQKNLDGRYRIIGSIRLVK